MIAHRIIKPGILTSMLIRLAYALILLSISRILLVLIAHKLYADVSLRELGYYYMVGLRFDLSSTLYLNAIFILLCIIPFSFRFQKLYRSLTSLVFIVTNSLGMLANLADAAYLPFSLKRTTSEILHALNTGGDISRLILDYFHDFWYVFLLWILLTFSLIWVNKRFNYLLASPKTANSLRNILIKTSLTLVIMAGTITGMRGGWQLKPISIISASYYSTSPIHTQLVLNTPFTFLTTLDNQPIPTPNFFPTLSAAESHFNPLQNLGNQGEFSPLNVVIIILESFSSEYSAFLNPTGNAGCTGFTPFLDSLMQEGIWFNGYANGTRSLEAVSAILSGLPSLLQIDFISSQYAGNCLPSLATALKSKHYTSVFYHGGHNGTMNFDAFALKTGFDKYIGMNEYNKSGDYDGKWGIFDEPFLKFFAQGLSSLQEPFLGVVFTLSSHHPYTIPKQYQNRFQGGRIPIHQTIEYSDYSLRRFFEEAKVSDWYHQTLFVITADHTSVGCEIPTQDPLSRYRIPIVFYQPGANLPKVDIVAQQCDIYPSILGILGFEEPVIAFGESIIKDSRRNFLMVGQNGEYLVKQRDTLVDIRDGEVRAAWLQMDDESIQEIPIQNVKQTELLGKAILQQYIYRLNYNLLCQTQ